MNRDKPIAAMYDDVYEAVAHNAVIDVTHGGYIGINTEGLTNELYADGYRKSTDVAREIFEEIESLMFDGAIGGKYPAKVINPDKFAELKKKYTEGEG